MGRFCVVFVWAFIAKRDMGRISRRTLFYSFGTVAEWLTQRSAKPLFAGSNPVCTSIVDIGIDKKNKMCYDNISYLINL